MTNFKAIFFPWQWLTNIFFDQQRKIQKLQKKIMYGHTYFLLICFFKCIHQTLKKIPSRKKWVKYFWPRFPKMDHF